MTSFVFWGRPGFFSVLFVFVTRKVFVKNYGFFPLGCFLDDLVTDGPA